MRANRSWYVLTRADGYWCIGPCGAEHGPFAAIQVAYVVCCGLNKGERA